MIPTFDSPNNPMSDIDLDEIPFDSESEDEFTAEMIDGLLVNTITGEVLGFPADENVSFPKEQFELEIPDPRPIAVVYIR